MPEVSYSKREKIVRYKQHTPFTRHGVCGHLYTLSSTLWVLQKNVLTHNYSYGLI